MGTVAWIAIIVIAIIIVVAIARSVGRPKGEYHKQQPGLSFGTLDRALQKDHIRRQAAEFTIAIDLEEVNIMIENRDFKLAEEKVREYLKDAEDRQDTVQIANMMGYLERIEIARKQRF